MVNAQTDDARPLPPDLEGLGRRLSEHGRAFRLLAHTVSTNDDARVWAAEGAPSGAVVCADAQSGGRGRQGRAWSTPPGETLALSVILRPTLPVPDLPKIALAAGLAARRAIDAALGRSAAKVKWPNDVLIDDRKICGVLSEAVLAGGRVEHVVVGVGINVARREFPPDLAAVATSLALEGGSSDRAALALGLLEALEDEVARLVSDARGIGARLAPHDALLGREVLFDDGTCGVAHGVDADGRLTVRTAGGVIRAIAGEVRLAPRTDRRG